jgi:hypothetical protein
VGAFRLLSLGGSSACIARHISSASLSRLFSTMAPDRPRDPVEGAVGQGHALVADFDPTVREVVDGDFCRATIRIRVRVASLSNVPEWLAHCPK